MLNQTTLKNKVRDIIANYWLNENKYCGLSSLYILDRIKDLVEGITEEGIKEILREMEKSGEISTREIEGTNRTYYRVTPKGVEEIVEPGSYVEIWAYPKRKLLEKYNTSKVEEVGIYTKQLRLGGSQISHRFFHRKVLDRYREDPRFIFEEWGTSGYICIKDAFYLDDSVPEADKICIQSFGKAYNSKGEEVVAVILAYLGQLSVEHQNYWSSYEIKEKCKLDADYVKTNFEAEWTDRISIYRAFSQELKEINNICDLIGEPHLFKRTFLENPPRAFSRLTKPTKGEYMKFIHTLDKMISENINREFFKGKINFREIIPIGKNNSRISDKSSLRLLEEYLEKYWKFPDPKPKEDMIKTFKDIRRMRQEPAHKIVDDTYDPNYFQKQHEIMNRIYGAIRILRLILKNHPKAHSYKPPKWLDEGRII